MLFGSLLQNMKFASLYLVSLPKYDGLNLSNFYILDAELRNSQIMLFGSVMQNV